jgi:hypothetical protein
METKGIGKFAARFCGRTMMDSIVFQMKFLAAFLSKG